MGANLALSRGYARSFQGTRAYSQQPFYPGKHLTLIGAIAIKGFLGGMTLEGGANGEEAISLGLDLITELDIRNWFAHGCYCTS